MTESTNPIPFPLAAAMLDLAAAATDDMLDDCCNALADAIIAHADDIDDAIATLIINTARLADPTESFHAAHLRDTLRDNCDAIIA